jgi:hypothetical protein
VLMHKKDTHTRQEGKHRDLMVCVIEDSEQSDVSTGKSNMWPMVTL